MATLYQTKYFAPGYQEKPPANGWYDIGADIGITNDHTVIVVMDRNTRKQVFYWRFCPGGSKNWHLNYDALTWVFNHFKFPLRVDCTGSGSSIPSEMPRRGVALEQWGAGEDKMKFSEYNKPIIMDNLSSLIGGHHIDLFNLPDIKNELKKMQRKAKATGKGFTIAAPKGENEHDDIPVALGLACMNIQPRLLNEANTRPLPMVGERSIWFTEEW